MLRTVHFLRYVKSIIFTVRWHQKVRDAFGPGRFIQALACTVRTVPQTNLYESESKKKACTGTGCAGTVLYRYYSVILCFCQFSRLW